MSTEEAPPTDRPHSAEPGTGPESGEVPDTGPGPGAGPRRGAVRRLATFFEHVEFNHRLPDVYSSQEHLLDDQESQLPRARSDIYGDDYSVTSANNQGPLYAFTLKDDYDDDDERLPDVNIEPQRLLDDQELQVYNELHHDPRNSDCQDSSSSVNSNATIYETTLDSIVRCNNYEDESDIYGDEHSVKSANNQGSLYAFTLKDDYDDDDERIYDVYETSVNNKGPLNEFAQDDRQQYDNDEDGDFDDDDDDDERSYDVYGRQIYFLKSETNERYFHKLEDEPLYEDVTIEDDITNEDNHVAIEDSENRIDYTIDNVISDDQDEDDTDDDKSLDDMYCTSLNSPTKPQEPSANYSQTIDGGQSHDSTSFKPSTKFEEPWETYQQSIVDGQSPDIYGSVRGKSEESADQTFVYDDSQIYQEIPDVLSGQYLQPDPDDLNSVFKVLEDNMVQFMKMQLSRFHRSLSPDSPENMYLESHCEDEGLIYNDDDEHRRRCRKAFLKITLLFLRRMKLDHLANSLKNRTRAAVCQRKLKTTLKKKYECALEGIINTDTQSSHTPVYTELYVTEGDAREASNEYETEADTWRTSQMQTIRQDSIFKASPGRAEPTRVLTKGVAGIGKTVLTQKFSLDWAEDKTNQNIHFTFPFTFRELNVLKEKKFSLVELVHHFFAETKEAGINRFEEFQVIFIFDGLDECRVPLDFHHTEILTDVTKSTSMHVLLTNLIRGNLLPSARLWITTRPAAADQIPSNCIDRVTEVRGFTDPQKEEYFRKVFTDEEQANQIISHIQALRSVHVMCRIPVFCWITSTVLEDMLKTREGGELATTLTEMYIYFLVVQSKVKTHGRSQQEKRKMIEFLGKMAFVQLEKGNLLFYESDLMECGINIRTATVYAEVFPQIFKENRGLYHDKVFCFVHLSVQEFLAALHVHLTFITLGVNLMMQQKVHTVPRLAKVFKDKPKLNHLHQSAVEKALKSPHGHMDLFLRFLLGLSEETNQSFLRNLLKHTGSSLASKKQTVEFINEKMKEDLSPEKSINLLYCLNELKDHSLTEEIQMSLRKGRLSKKNLSPGQWAALVSILLSSANDLDVFDLKKYSASEEALLRLLPVVKASKRVVLSSCNLSERSCEALALVLSSQSCSLRHLDLSNNHLQDSGVKKLCEGLKSPHCFLEVLSLTGCLITDESCVSLATALSLNPSYLRELDVSNNNLQESGVKLLSAGRSDATWRLDTLKVDQFGEQMFTSALRKFSCELALNPITAHRNLRLSNRNRKVELVTGLQPYPEDPERFDIFCQVLCGNGLSGRCYWEVEWIGKVDVALTLRAIGRKGYGKTRRFGGNQYSWCLSCSDHGYSVWHDDHQTPLCSTYGSHRVGVYVDCLAGVLSFYSVSNHLPVHLHTFKFSFTGLLYPGFRVWFGSVSLCSL